MKTKIKELKNRNKEELNSLLRENRNNLLETRMKSEASKLKNVKAPKEIKKNIARILTLLNSSREIYVARIKRQGSFK